MVEVQERDTTSNTYKKENEGQLSTDCQELTDHDSEYEVMIPQTHTAQIAVVELQPNTEASNTEQLSTDCLTTNDAYEAIDSQTLAMQEINMSKECKQELGTDHDEDDYEVIDETPHTIQTQTVTVQHNAAYRLLDMSEEYPHECSV